MHVRIATRFNGPPDSGNGGYSCGLIARAVGEPVRVRLQRPVPMEVNLKVASAGEGQWEIRSDAELIATAASHRVAAEVPQAPSWIEAFGASHHYAGLATHNFPTCFTCGPGRAPGDGLRIFSGAVPGTQVLAAPWRPHTSLADANGHLRPEFVWAALDCPGYWATCHPSVALLGELAVSVEHVPQIDEPCVVISWRIGGEGRKHRAGTALFDASGARCAVGIATWIELKQPE
jgi:hypothetical protein